MSKHNNRNIVTNLSRATGLPLDLLGTSPLLHLYCDNELIVEGAKNLVTSCSYKIKEGMVIKTNTQKVLNARKMAIELLLSNHNKDCTSCPKNLKCELQKLSNEYLCDSTKFDGEILNAIYLFCDVLFLF